MKKPIPVALAGPGLMLAAAALSAMSASAFPAPLTRSAAAVEAGRKVYFEACAACHGSDGKGVSQSLVGFTQPIRDFTDCRSTASEPDSDWMAVIRLGGTGRGFSELMPAFGDVLKPEEIAAAVSYLRTFCPGRTWPRGDLNLPRAQFTEKAFPEDEAVLTTAVDTTGHGLVSNAILYEQRFGARTQVELSLPFGWRRAPDATGALAWSANLGDASVGLKRLLYHNYESGSILSATAEMTAPTGDQAQGFGKGTFVFEPFVSFGQLFAADVFLQAQAGFEIPFRTSKAENEAYFNLALGKSFSTGRYGRTWTPMIELLAARELTAGARVDLDVVPQFQVTLSRRKHIMANIGVRLPVNNTAGRTTRVVFYLIWDWFDGTMFEGW